VEKRKNKYEVNLASPNHGPLSKRLDNTSTPLLAIKNFQNRMAATFNANSSDSEEAYNEDFQFIGN
jgi:hypothetical protein